MNLYDLILFRHIANYTDAHKQPIGWLSGYSHRKLITLSENGETLFNYQLKLDTSYEGAMDIAFDDLRFTLADGETLINAWLESKIDGSSAEIWVKFPTTAEKYFMYYGKTDAVANWDGIETFLQYHDEASANYLDTLCIYPDNIIYETVARSNIGNTNIWYGLGKTLADNPNDAVTAKINQLSSTHKYTFLNSFNNGSLTYYYQTDIYEGAYVDIRLEIHDAELHGFYNNVELFSTITTNLPNELLGLGSFRASGGGDQKWSFVRKYAATTPTYEFGAEETA